MISYLEGIYILLLAVSIFFGILIIYILNRLRKVERHLRIVKWSLNCVHSRVLKELIIKRNQNSPARRRRN